MPVWQGANYPVKETKIHSVCTGVVASRQRHYMIKK